MKRINQIKFSVLLITACLITITSIAQIDDDFEQWKKKEQEKFLSFRDERDKAFTEFLKREWREMQLMQGVIPDEAPKPIEIPVYTPPVDAPSLVIPDEHPIIEKIPLPQPPPEAQPDVKPPPPPEPRRESKALQVPFFDVSLTILYDDSLKVSLGAKLDKDAISAFWEALSHSNYEAFLRQVQAYKSQMQLNDWGYALLLYQIAERLYEGDHNPSHLFVWFTLSKSGYVAKVGYDADRVYLLLPSVNTVYGVQYATFTGDSRRFYVVAFERDLKPPTGSLYTYDGDYPGAERLIDFKLDRLPNVGNREGDRTLQFSYKDKNYAFNVKFNQSTVDFLKAFPSTDLSVYFNASLSLKARFSLFSALKPILEGKSKIEAINVLLRFVQTAFAYKTDSEQFGKEKALFPEESLFYDYSDCEDRSILFAYLVRKLLGLEVIGLDYPGHIATAVKLEADIAGHALTYKDQKYMLCDPTYTNADVGMCMPNLTEIDPTVIQVGF